MVDDIGLILRGLIKDSEYSLATNGTTTAHCLVEHNGTGIIAATANSIKVIGAESRGLGTTTGLPITFKTTGITPVATLGKLTVGIPIKSGPGGKAVPLLDLSMVSTALGDFTTKAGGNFANQPANDSIDVVSDAAGDVGQTVTAYGWTQAGLFATETFVLNGVNQVLGATLWSKIHAVTVSAAHTGNIEVHEHSASAVIVTLAAATLTVGRNAVVDGIASCANPGFVASGASTKYIVIVGTGTTGAALSEQLQLTGAVLVVAANAYSVVTYVLTGDVESAQTVTGTLSATQDDENARVGLALTGVASAGDIYVALK